MTVQVVATGKYRQYGFSSFYHTRKDLIITDLDKFNNYDTTC